MLGLNAVGIVSEDIAKSVQFYEMLGLAFHPEGSEDHWEATTPTGLRVMLDSASLMRKIQPQWKPSGGGGVTLCFLQSTPKDVDTLFAKVVGAGFEAITKPWDAFWGQRYATVRDPDGNSVDIFADQPKKT